MSAADSAYHPNLSYQSFSGTRGGSDSERKLTAIQLPDLKGKRFLDLGCNAGFFCAHAKAAGASHVVGVDNSANVIEVARTRHPEIEFFDTGWDRFPDGEFDVVICLSAVHYAKSQTGLAEDIRTHLSQAGLFVLEGGVIDDERLAWTDLPVVAFREVGDRVRHLSTGFLRRHMLAGYDWSVIAPSITQGGDPIPRFVIHARKASENDTAPAASNFRLCPVEYAAALALSAPAIQEAQPSFAYVRALGAASLPLARADIMRVLDAPEALARFADDVAYALKGHGTKLKLRGSLGAGLTGRLARLLEERGIKVDGKLATAAEPLPATPESSANSEHDATPYFKKCLAECALSGARVADLTGPGGALWPLLLEAGAAEVHMAAADDWPLPDPRIITHPGVSWEIAAENFDYAFFDATAMADFDDVDDVSRLAEWLGRRLSPDGVAYLALKTGHAQTNWDVFNRVLLTPIGRLPSSDYLYNDLLSDFAVRPQQTIRAAPDHRPYSITRLVRVAPRRPTLLAIIGASQSGKTTLARKMMRLPDSLHFSSDYLYVELGRLKAPGMDIGLSEAMLKAISGTSPSDVGSFFRTIEADRKLFEEYLKIVATLIPRGRSMISFDLDVRRPRRIDELRRFFTERGFTVWVATR